MQLERLIVLSLIDLSINYAKGNINMLQAIKACNQYQQGLERSFVLKYYEGAWYHAKLILIYTNMAKTTWQYAPYLSYNTSYMQKYLSVKNRLRKRQPQEQSAFTRLRRQLQAQGQISKDLLQAALSHSKLPAIREVLLFCRYDELKSLLDPHISPEDLSQHTELGRIYRLNVAQREKEQGKGEPAEGMQPSSMEGKRRWRIMLAIAVGIGVFVLVFLLRSRWRQAVSRLFQK